MRLLCLPDFKRLPQAQQLIFLQLLPLALAQMDPVMVSTMTSGDGKLSVRAKNLLNTWASWDDPVTVAIFCVAAAPLTSGNTSVVGQIATSFAPVAIAVFIVVAQKFAGKHLAKVFADQRVQIACAFLAITAAYVFHAYLLMAVAGWFIRPKIFVSKVEKILDAALLTFVFLLCVVIANVGFAASSLYFGFVLGLAGYGVHIPVAWLMTLCGGYKRHERWLVAFAHRSGMTALSLALAIGLLSPDANFAVPTIATAILTVWLANLATNKLYKLTLVNEARTNLV